MTRKELTDRLTEIVREYIANAGELVDPQIRINPRSMDIGVVTGKEMFAEIEDYDETLEAAAAAQGAADEDDSDYQVAQTPDFYSVKELVATAPDGSTVPDAEAIADIAGQYAE